MNQIVVVVVVMVVGGVGESVGISLDPVDLFIAVAAYSAWSDTLLPCWCRHRRRPSSRQDGGRSARYEGRGLLSLASLLYGCE